MTSQDRQMHHLLIQCDRLFDPLAQDFDQKVCTRIVSARQSESLFLLPCFILLQCTNRNVHSRTAFRLVDRHRFPAFNLVPLLNR